MSRALGLAINSDLYNENYLYGNIDSKMLKESLINFDDQVIINLLSLL